MVVLTNYTDDNGKDLHRGIGIEDYGGVDQLQMNTIQWEGVRKVFKK